jgi:MFS family permease
MHSSQVLAIIVATFLNALDGFDVLSISFAAPGIADDWGISRAALGVVLSMELIGMAIGAFVLGALADRRGRRPTILGSLAIMATGMALAAASNGIVMLSSARLFTGLGIGGMLAATNAIVAESSNARRRNLSVAIMAGGYPLGAVIGGSVASGLLVSTGRWQSIFEFGALATASFIPIVLWLLPETISFLCDRQPRGAIEKINRTLVRQGRTPIATLPMRPDFPRSSGIAEAFAPGQAGVTILLTISYFAHIMTFYFFVKWVPKIVVDLGYSAASAGGVLVWANVGGAIGSVVLSLLTQRIGVRPLVIGAMVAGSLVVAAFGRSVTLLTTLTALSAVTALAGFFINGATAGLYAVFAQSFPVQLRASGTGIVIGVGRGGAALGPILGGLLFSIGWPLAWVAPTMACGCFVGALTLGCVRYRENGA